MNGNSAHRRTPGTLQVFRQDVSSARRYFRNSFDPLVNWLFEFTQRGSKRRTIFFVLISAVLWVTLALISNPPVRSNVPWLLQVFQAVTSTAIIRHFLMLGLAMFLATRMAAIYLDDIYELEDVSKAERFIRSAAFSGSYPIVHIIEGDIKQQDQSNPVFAIGGPGRVNVAMENATLFERIDGIPHVISASDRRFNVIDGFERLRSIVDLRNQSIQFEVTGRTQDGIPVMAKDIRAEFSIARGSQTPSLRGNFPHPYPFSTQAVQKLVYREGKERLPDKGSMESYIRGNLLKFISRHTLNEFISNVDPERPAGSFVPQDELKESFYKQAAEIEERGLTLHWIGIGTWVLPNEIIANRHLEAWKISSENRIQRSAPTLQKVYNLSRLAGLLSLIDEFHTLYLRLNRDNPSNPGIVIHDLLIWSREKMKSARILYEAQGQPSPPDLDPTIKYITDSLRPQP